MAKKTKKTVVENHQTEDQTIDLSNVECDFKKLDPKSQYYHLRKLKPLKKAIKFLSLPADKRKALREYQTLARNNRAKPKKDFNPENIFEVRDLNLWYNGGEKQALFDINFDIKKNKVTALIGPSGCGKSTFLRNLNRMHDFDSSIIVEGDIWFNGQNINAKKYSLMELRTKVGMVFQKPTPFNMSIYDNVAFGPKNHGIKDKTTLDNIVKQSLKDAALWEDVKNDLQAPATSLSGGQQQRLCIARSIALQPDVLLMDEPTSALDPIATGKIEKLIKKLSDKVTIVIVTHSMTQAQRISDNTIFFLKGKVIEADTTKNIFTRPKSKELRHYLNGDDEND